MSWIDEDFNGEPNGEFVVLDAFYHINQFKSTLYSDRLGDDII